MRRAIQFLLALGAGAVPAGSPAVETGRGGDGSGPMPPAVQKARSAFEAVAREVYSEILPMLPREQKEEIFKVLGCDEADSAEKSAEFLVLSCAALTPPEREAAAIAAGEFNDAENLAKAASSAQFLASLQTPLPYLLTHLMEKIAAKRIQNGIHLEFTARLLVFYSSRAIKVMADAKMAK